MDLKTGVPLCRGKVRADRKGKGRKKRHDKTPPIPLIPWSINGKHPKKTFKAGSNSIKLSLKMTGKHFPSLVRQGPRRGLRSRQCGPIRSIHAKSQMSASKSSCNNKRKKNRRHLHPAPCVTGAGLRSAHPPTKTNLRLDRQTI